MAYLDHESFFQIQPRELTRKAWLDTKIDPSVAANVKEITQRFNQVSHKRATLANIDFPAT